MQHVYPLNDSEPHDLTSHTCKCNPRVEQDEYGDWIVIHNSFDFREVREEINAYNQYCHDQRAWDKYERWLHNQREFHRNLRLLKSNFLALFKIPCNLLVLIIKKLQKSVAILFKYAIIKVDKENRKKRSERNENQNNKSKSS